MITIEQTLGSSVYTVHINETSHHMELRDVKNLHALLGSALTTNRSTDVLIQKVSSAYALAAANQPRHEKIRAVI